MTTTTTTTTTLRADVALWCLRKADRFKRYCKFYGEARTAEENLRRFIAIEKLCEPMATKLRLDPSLYPAMIQAMTEVES
jgi:hypothetical protein